MLRLWRKFRTRELVVLRPEPAPERLRSDARVLRGKPFGDSDGARRRLLRTVEDNRIL
jgi:hypothetical protein